MSLAIALTNSQGKDAGFVLVAGVDEVCRRGSGRWKGRCIFVTLSTEPTLLPDAAYLELAGRTEHGEHSLRVANDGTAVSLVAADTSGKRFYATIPTDGPGEWGTIRGGKRSPSGGATFAD